MEKYFLRSEKKRLSNFIIKNSNDLIGWYNVVPRHFALQAGESNR